MRFRTDLDPFAAAVGWATASVPPRPTAPILAGVRLSVTGGRLAVSGFDGEVSSTAYTDVATDGDAELLVSGRLLAEIVKALPDEPVTLASDGSRAVLTCAGTRFGLPTMPVADHPALPELPAVAGEVDATALAGAVAQTAVAAGRDDTLPVLTGVQWELSDSSMTLSATDRYRIGMRELDWRPARPGVAVTTLLPARTLAATAKTLGDTGGGVEICTDGVTGLIGLRAGRFHRTARVLDGRLPDLRAQLAHDFGTRIEVATDVLAAAVRRVSLVSPRHARVRLAAEPGRLAVEAGGDDDADARAELDCGYDGPPLRLAFHLDYLSDGLTACGAPRTVLAVDAARQRVLLTGTSADGDPTAYAGYRYLLVPLQSRAGLGFPAGRFGRHGEGRCQCSAGTARVR